MDKIKKFLKKVSQKERDILYKRILDLQSKNTSNLNIKKLINSNFFRLRVGKFRIIFFYKNKKFIISDIKYRNDNTYKNFKK